MDKESLLWGYLFVLFFGKKEKRTRERVLGDQVEILFMSQGLQQEIVGKGEMGQGLPSFKRRATVFLFLLHISILFMISQKIP